MNTGLHYVGAVFHHCITRCALITQLPLIVPIPWDLQHESWQRATIIPSTLDMSLINAHPVIKLIRSISNHTNLIYCFIVSHKLCFYQPNIKQNVKVDKVRARNRISLWLVKNVKYLRITILSEKNTQETGLAVDKCYKRYLVELTMKLEEEG